MSNARLGAEWTRYLELKNDRPALFIDNGSIHIVLDETIVAEYQEKNNRKIGVVYESAYNIMVVDLVYEEEGKYFAYERLVPTVEKGAVVMIPIHKESFIVLKQYRHALRDYQYAFPRGFGEKDLTAEENCEKELREEIGGEVIKAEYLGEVAPDSGVLGNVVSVYVCELASYDSSSRSEGICDMMKMDRAQIKDLIAKGKITDGFTLAALSLYDASQYTKGEKG